MCIRDRYCAALRGGCCVPPCVADVSIVNCVVCQQFNKRTLLLLLLLLLLLFYVDAAAVWVACWGSGSRPVQRVCFAVHSPDVVSCQRRVVATWTRCCPNGARNFPFFCYTHLYALHVHTGTHTILMAFSGVHDWLSFFSNVHPCLRAWVRPYVRPQKFLRFNEIWYVRRGRWVMHDGMQYDPIQGQGYEPSKLEILPFSTAISYAIYNGS